MTNNHSTTEPQYNNLSDPMDDRFYCIKTADRSYTGVIGVDSNKQPITYSRDPKQIRERLDKYWR